MTKRKIGYDLYVDDIEVPVQTKKIKTISLLSDNEDDQPTETVTQDLMNSNSSDGKEEKNKESVLKQLMPESPNAGAKMPELENHVSIIPGQSSSNVETEISVPDSDPMPVAESSASGDIRNLPDAECADIKECFPGMIDFTIKSGEYRSDLNLTSSDGTVFYSNVPEIISNKAGSKIPFNKDVVNLLLNFIHNSGKFNHMIREEPDFKISEHTITGLWRCAIYLNFLQLEEICILITNNRLERINEEVNLLYTERKRDKRLLYKGVIEGRISFGPDVSKQFLSNCYDFGMQHGEKDGVIMNIIPWYVATDDQLRMFKKKKGYELLGFKRPNTMKIFLKLFQKKSTPGSIKLLYRIAEMLYL